MQAKGWMRRRVAGRAAGERRGDLGRRCCCSLAAAVGAVLLVEMGGEEGKRFKTCLARPIHSPLKARMNLSVFRKMR